MLCTVLIRSSGITIWNWQAAEEVDVGNGVAEWTKVTKQGRRECHCSFAAQHFPGVAAPLRKVPAAAATPAPRRVRRSRVHFTPVRVLHILAVQVLRSWSGEHGKVVQRPWTMDTGINEIRACYGRIFVAKAYSSLFPSYFLKWLCFPLKSRDGPGDQFEVIV